MIFTSHLDLSKARIEDDNSIDEQNKTIDNAISGIELQIQKFTLDQNKIIIIEIDDDSIPNEITGLLAMQISAKYKKPTLVLRRDSNNVLKGSGRCPGHCELTDFKQFLNESGCCEYALGHPQAFGVGVPAASLERLINFANLRLQDMNFNEDCYEVNYIREGNEDISDLVNALGSVSTIWGEGLPEPLICINNVKICQSSLRIMGKNQDTLRIVTPFMTFVKFKAEDMITELQFYLAEKDTITLQLICKANINEWNGRRSLQCFIENYEVKE